MLSYGLLGGSSALQDGDENELCKLVHLSVQPLSSVSNVPQVPMVIESELADNGLKLQPVTLRSAKKNKGNKGV